MAKEATLDSIDSRIPVQIGVARRARITCEVQLVSPLHITAFESGRYLPDAERIVTGASEGGVPCSITRKMPVVRKEPVTTQNGVYHLAQVPVIPSSTLCGKLRNLASKIIEAQFIAANKTTRPETFQTMRSGAATATMKRDQQGITLSLAGANDPFFGLFGGTTFAISSNLVVHEGYALTSDTVDLIPFQFRTPVIPPKSYDTLGAVPVVRKDQTQEWAEVDHFVNIVGQEAALDFLADQSARMAASKAKKAAGESGKKEDLRTVAAVEVVRPGVWFGWTFDVTYRNDQQLGLFLLALEKLVAEGQLGGGKAKGRGRFVVATARLSVLDEGDEPYTAEVFQPRMVEGAVLLNRNDSVIGRVTAATESWLETVDPSTYDAFSADDAPVRFKVA